MRFGATVRRRCATGGVAAILASVIGIAGSAHAAYMSSDQRVEAAGFLTTQNTFHHDSVETFDWVQFRNEFRFDFRYFLWPASMTIGPFSKGRLSLLYRARYDAVYDIRESFRKRDYDRDDFRFPEGKTPREFFLDLEFLQPIDGLSLRIGKQQIVWGEADLFRSIDVVNPLRLDQNGLIGDDFDEYREPLWIAKALYRIGDVFPFLHTNSALEFFFSPNSRPLTNRIIVGEAYRKGVDQNHAAVGSVPEEFNFQNSIPFQQVRHPWELSRVGSRRTDAPDQADLGVMPGCNDLVAVPIPDLGGAVGLACADFVYLVDDQYPTTLLSLDAGMAGVRFLTQTFAGVDISFNYLYKRSEVPGTALAVYDLFDINNPNPPGGTTPNFRNDKLIEGLTADPAVQFDRCVHGHEPVIVAASIHGQHFDQPTGTFTNNASTGCELVDFWYPWQHIVGTTLTYNDFDYTGFIWRVEQSFVTKEPRNSMPPLAGPRRGQFPTARDFATHIKRDTQVWRSMIGFDYLRSIYPGAPLSLRKQWWYTFLSDQWFFTFQFFNEYYAHVRNQIGLLDSVTDRMQHFNPVLTYVMTGFFMHEKFRPWIAYGYDVNADFHAFWLQGEYFLRSDLSLRIGEILYTGSRFNESFLFLHKYADRDTFFARLTYYFL